MLNPHHNAPTAESPVIWGHVPAAKEWNPRYKDPKMVEGQGFRGSGLRIDGFEMLVHGLEMTCVLNPTVIIEP